MADWFHQVEQGSLSTELLCLRLENATFGAFMGQGFLQWSPDKGIEISALTNGGEALSRDFFAHLQMPIGTLIPPNAYLRLTATTRGGGSITSERLQFDGYDAHTSHDTVVWSIDRSQIASVIDFTKGVVSDRFESVSFLLTNGEGIVWPRISPTGQRCLECQTTLGKVTAYAIPGGKILINVDAEMPQELSRIIDAVSFAFCFWAGKILPVVAYEARIGDSVHCRLHPAEKLNTAGEAPPFGHVISLELETFHEVLLQRAIDFFAKDERGVIGPLIHTRLSCPAAPFSVGILVLCSALEGIAKEVSKATGIGKEIPASVRDKVVSCFREGGLSDDMTNRFLAFVSTVNAPNAANAISEWCKTNFLGFDAEDKKAWDYRNKSAHGNFALYGNRFDERKVSVAKRDRLANMINKLVMHAIGYEGKYLDYATYSVQEFPPKLTADAQ